MNSNYLFRQKSLVTAVATATLLGGQASWVFAQDKAVIEEVMVTATRREQSIQDIPFNISAVSGSDILAANILDSTELLRTIPGISVADGGARAAETNNNISIRGLNIDPNSTDRLFLSDPTVSTYVGNTPTFSNFILRDVNRVEVLRGPQGTLYGSGSLGGTVRYIMNKPDTSEFGGSISGSFGQTDGSEGNNMNVDGMINIPISDTMAFRLSAGEIDNDGVVDYVNSYALGPNRAPLAQGGDIANGLPVIVDKEDADTVDIWYARASLLFEPSDDLSMVLSYQQQSGEYGGRRQVTTAQNGFGEEYGEYEIGSVLLEPASNDTSFGSLEIEYDLGFATLSSSTSYYDNSRESVTENTGFYAARGWLVYYGYGNNPRLALAADRKNSERAFIQELRLVSSGDDNMIDWTVGAYYMDQSGSALQESNFLGFNEWNAAFGVFGFYNPDDNSSFTWTYDREFEDLAVFGEMTFHAREDLHLTLGFRSFDNEDTVTSSTSFPIYFIYNPEVTSSKSDNGILFKGNLSWEVDDITMVYATISEGYRRGGTNAVPVFPGPFPNDLEWGGFEPDTVINYEIGLKAQTENVSYTLSAFYVDWKDPQLNVSTPSGAYYAVANGEGAKSTGIEVEFDWAVSESLRVSGGYAHVSAKLTDDFLTPDANPTTFGRNILQAPEGTRLPGTAENTVNLTVAHTTLLSDGMSLVSRADGYYQSKVENSILVNNPQWEQTFDGFYLWNFSATLIAEKWSASLYLKNAFNEEGTTASYKEEFMSTDPANGYFGTGQKDFISNPRTVGIYASYIF